MPVPDGLRAQSLLVTKVPQENKSLVLWEEIPGQESNIPKIKPVLPLSWPCQESQFLFSKMEVVAAFSQIVLGRKLENTNKKIQVLTL